jgi:hypothetical protein
MSLKSYSIIKKRKTMKKNKKRKMLGDTITGGITALVGVGLLSETASAVSSL